jgi:hypothetical protein
MSNLRIFSIGAVTFGLIEAAVHLGIVTVAALLFGGLLAVAFFGDRK